MATGIGHPVFRMIWSLSVEVRLTRQSRCRLPWLLPRATRHRGTRAVTNEAHAWYVPSAGSHQIHQLTC